MTLEELVEAGWRDHAEDAAGVLARLPGGAALVTERKHLPGLAGLIVHVAGEHLGRWADGLALLEGLRRTPAFDPASPEGKAVRSSEAVLHLGAGDRAAAERCLAAARTGGDVPEAGDRARALAVVSAAFLGQGRMAEARAAFEEALRLAAYGPKRGDPTARALAVTANNLACALEVRERLDADETASMLRAARAGLEHWSIAGGWRETERAHYRLAMSHVRAGQPAGAVEHARRCVEIVEANGTEPGEAFFAREALARARHAAGDLVAARRERDAAAAHLPSIADEGFRSLAAEELRKLDASLGAPS